MKKYLLTLPALLCLAFAQAQQSQTFVLEDKKTIDGYLPSTTYTQILKNLLLKEKGDHGFTTLNYPDYPYNIVAQSKITDSLVDYGYHPFFKGMYEAYANHHGFTVSPDMVWLLIAQGFAHHVNAHAEELRPMFVNFSGKLSLIVKNDAINLNDPNSPWEEVFPEFVKKIGEHTGQDLMNTLSPDFTTTTPVDKIATDITIMEAMKEYFDFIEMTSICGIPKITIEGSPKDWQKILRKAHALRKYKLDWWIDEIAPALWQFKHASMGNCDTVFWRNMFKQHTLQKYGKPKIIDGWIIKFFPYDKYGNRNNPDSLHEWQIDKLPDEMVKVDLKYIQQLPLGKFKTTPLELWAGFVGLREDTSTFGFTPQTGWMVRKKDTTQMVKQRAFEKFDAEDDAIDIRVATVPPEILKLKKIEDLTIHFTGNVLIPEGMAYVNIDFFSIYGQITADEITRIRKLLPKTRLTINGVQYYPKNSSL